LPKGEIAPARFVRSSCSLKNLAMVRTRSSQAWLQAAPGSDRPVPLLYDTKSGHSGGRPINKIIEENTDIPSFLFCSSMFPQTEPHVKIEGRETRDGLPTECEVSLSPFQWDHA